MSDEHLSGENGKFSVRMREETAFFEKNSSAA